MAFACLEVVLDRGQTEDWFESNFIIGFLPDRHHRAGRSRSSGSGGTPTRSSKFACSRDRNFALANIFYFFFGFSLFGSTVLIPQISSVSTATPPRTPASSSAQAPS